MAKKNKLNFTIFKRLLSYWKNYKGLFFLSVTCTLILAFLSPLRPIFIGDMVSKYIENGQDASKLLTWTLIVIGILIVEGFFPIFIYLLFQSICPINYFRFTKEIDG